MTAQSYKTEFPGYVLDVEIPAGFEDISWHYDECPSFYGAEHSLILWVDFINPADREFSQGTRFALTGADEDGCSLGDSHTTTNDFAEILQYLDAHKAEGFPRLEEI